MGGAEGFQRAIGKPFGRLRRGEIPAPHAHIVRKYYQLNREMGVERDEVPSQVQGSALLGSRGKVPWGSAKVNIDAAWGSWYNSQCIHMPR